MAGGFRIDNIPFYARELACNDIVAVEKEADGLLRFAGLVKAAGHSTIRLWFARESDIDSVRRDLGVLGCDSERAFSRLVAVDVPPLVDYGGVRKFLDDLEIQGVLEFEEACLGQAHRLAMPE